LFFFYYINMTRFVMTSFVYMFDPVERAARGRARAQTSAGYHPLIN